MIRFKGFLLSVVAAALATISAEAQTADFSYSPFIVWDDMPGVIALSGRIDAQTHLAFDRLLRDHPAVDELLLNSGGGNVDSGLVIARRVHQLGFKTTITRSFKCLSACSYIFFAGKQRKAFGQLGVHQFHREDGGGDMKDAQLKVADILDVLNRFDVNPNIFSRVMPS